MLIFFTAKIQSRKINEVQKGVTNLITIAEKIWNEVNDTMTGETDNESKH